MIAMKRKMLFGIIAFVFVSTLIKVWAQDAPFSIMYRVQSISKDTVRTTVTLAVGVSHGGGEVATHVSVKLASPIGDDTNVQGELFFNTIEAGQLKMAAGIFSAPHEFFNETTMDSPEV